MLPKTINEPFFLSCISRHRTLLPIRHTAALKVPHDASWEVLQEALTALEPIYSAGVELANIGALSAWHVTLVSAQDYEPLFADGYLLQGTNAVVTVSGNTGSGSSSFPYQSNCLGTGSRSSCREKRGHWTCAILE